MVQKEVDFFFLSKHQTNSQNISFTTQCPERINDKKMGLDHTDVFTRSPPELKAGTKAESNGMLLAGLHRLVFGFLIHPRTTCPGNETTHTGPGPPTSITNQGNLPLVRSQANLMTSDCKLCFFGNRNKEHSVVPWTTSIKPSPPSVTGPRFTHGILACVQNDPGMGCS